jgi:hypothetical protein
MAEIDQHTEETQGEAGLDYDGWNGLDIMQSMCVNCRGEGTTILKLHKVPHFKELIIASFSCPHCRYKNNEVSFGGEIQVQGCVCELTLSNPHDLNRQFIKSDSACVRIPIQFSAATKHIYIISRQLLSIERFRRFSVAIIKRTRPCERPYGTAGIECPKL